MRDLNEKEKLDLILSIVNIIAGTIMVIGGVFLLFDDVHDFGETDHGGEYLKTWPWPLSIVREKIHHWHWGIILIFLGVFISIIAIIRIKLIMDPEFKDRVLEFIKNLEERLRYNK